MSARTENTERAIATSRSSDGTLVIRLSGPWLVSGGLADPNLVGAALQESPKPRRVAFDTEALADWDSTLVRFLMGTSELLVQQGVEVDSHGLPTGAQRLVHLALAVPVKTGTGRDERRTAFFELVGKRTLSQLKGAGEMLSFLGDVTLMFGRYVARRANYRRSDLVQTIQECGAESLPIVTIISLLVGLILAFVGAIQLQQFGAQIFVADLVGIAMAREMAAIMTAIVLAGRTGAAFAANIGTMQGNEEIDALVTFGISPMDFLVLPRMLALILMTPLLVIYACFVGIVGGWLVGVGMLDLSTTAYIHETQAGVALTDFAIGIFKGGVFGAVVAIAGCLRGMQCGRSSAAVGAAATSAVVTGIVSIILIDALFAVLTNVLGI